MKLKIAVAVCLAAVLSVTLVPASLPQAFAANTAASITVGASSKTTDAFSPNPININVGDTVTWTNDDSQPHTVTSGSSGTPDGKFDSSPNFKPLLVPKQTFSHTFTQAGDYPYFCALHPNMVGTVKVAATTGGEGNNNTGGGQSMQTAVTAKTADGKSFNITSTSTTSKVIAATINEGKSVTVTFDKSGDIVLTLPKAMIDSVTNVTAAGKTVQFNSTNNTNSTSLTLTLPTGATSIDIMGATVVPEFPVIAVMILAGSIAAIIGYTRFARSNATRFTGI